MGPSVSTDTFINKMTLASQEMCIEMSKDRRDAEEKVPTKGKRYMNPGKVKAIFLVRMCECCFAEESLCISRLY